MTRSTPRTALAAALALCLGAGGMALLSPTASAAEPKDKTNSGSVVAGTAYDRFLVHFTEASAADTDDAAARAEVAEVAKGAGHKLTVTRRLSTEGVLVQVDEKLGKDKADKLIDKFRAKAEALAPRYRTAFVTP